MWKPSPAIETVSPWRGIPDNTVSGHRRAAVRRDQIWETDRITGEITLTLNDRQILQQCVLLVASPIKPGCGVAFRDYCCPSNVSVSPNDPPYPGFLFLPLPLSGCGINMDYTPSLSLIGLQTAGHQMTHTLRPQTSNSNQNASTHLRPFIVCYVSLSDGGAHLLQCRNNHLKRRSCIYHK